MGKGSFTTILACLALVLMPADRAAQERAPDIKVMVDMVQVNVAVTDKNDNYVTGLRPENFVITEDGIAQKIATFAEGNRPVRALADLVPNADEVTGEPGASQSAELTPAKGTSVFILFDTSNYMYRGFVFAQDAIADFVRSLDETNLVAFYSYSRNLSRAAPLTSDRTNILRGVRETVAGDDAALYNSLLLTIKDAAKFPGRKVVVVFSNGPDNASMVPPEDVAELAQSVGAAIYMICTREARLEPISTAVFQRMTAATGGKAYFAKDWRDEKRAFASIRDDLAHLYSVSYYPQANPNPGWRTIKVKLVGEKVKKYRVRTRNGYRLQRTRSAQLLPQEISK